ncbi:MAG: hypothetical protein H6898_08610 [Rhodobacter sp.]|nr:hypothetical protein [Paracoccaceae bacterium]MCC0076636.1 hypothetical protein [Rhodobacter sp.]
MRMTPFILAAGLMALAAPVPAQTLRGDGWTTLHRLVANAARRDKQNTIICLDGEVMGPDGRCADGSNPPQPQPGENACQYAYNNQCDESRYGGTGACYPGTDTYDCTNQRPGADSCIYHHNNRCDEPGLCAPGTDTADCAQRSIGDNDSCPWAHNNRCDEARYGGAGICADGTDTSDCRGTRGDPPADRANSCQWANDGECDDPTVPGHHTSACAPGTDTNDCNRMLADPGNGCRWAHDGECDDPTVPGHITSACAPGTDNADCGR